MIPSNPICQNIRITTAGAVKATPGRLLGVLLFGGSAATSIKFTNDADGNGTPLLDVNVAVAETLLVDLSLLGGIYFDTKIYGKLAGTGGIATVFYD
jgi:hypothetical protein